MTRMPRRIVHGAAAASAALVCSAALAGAKVWDSRDLWATSPTGESDMDARLTGAFAQFADWPAYVAVAVSGILAIALSWLLAHAARGRVDRIEILEERKTLVLVGFASSVAAFVASIEPVMAVVLAALAIFLRADGVVRSSPMRARVLLVVGVGAAAGLSQYVLALLAAALGLVVLRWLGGFRYANVKVRVGLATDRERARALVGATLARLNCRVLGAREGRSGRALIFTARVPAGVTDELLAKGLEASLAPEIGAVSVAIGDAGAKGR
ncbi:MAG: hypothetical protein RL325_1751 [Planctomycetota bacterium]|jgi:hypothetical protein